MDSALALGDMIAGVVVECAERDVDRYGRIVAECFYQSQSKGRVNINAEMVEQGHALAYRKYSTDYVRQEQGAQANSRGMWQGEFEAPWDWRKDRRANKN